MYQQFLHHLHISIHAPAKGATNCILCIAFALQYFNPRSREGSDIISLQGGFVMEISIHAPAKGATIFVGQCFLSLFNFNPRSHEGSDFNHPPSFILCTDFNPRSREGSDSKRFCFILDPCTISIHAPAKGATR